VSSKRNQSQLKLTTLVVTLAGGGFLAAAHAQEQPQSSSAEQPVQKLEEVTVTGSRIKRTNDFNTPTPTTVIDSSVLENLGIVNLGQALQDIPSNLSAFTPANTGNSAFFTGSYLADLRGLNPFFGSRTLTLIDTQRAVQTNQGDGFDLNMIPQILVQRIDTVTGGASAAYGSGAISGVVNIILDRKLEGGKFNMDESETNYSDGKDRHIAAAYGHSIMDDRVHFVLGGEYEHQDSIGCQKARNWCGNDVGFYQNGAIPNSTGSTTATYGFGSNLHTAVISPSGAFFPPNSLPWTAGQTLSTYQVNADGTTLSPYTTGVFPYGSQTATPTATSTVIGGDGTPANQYVNLLPEIGRGVLTAMVDAKITDTINFKADANFGKVTTNTGVFGNTTQPFVLYFPPGVFGPTAFASVPANITPQNAYIDPNNPNSPLLQAVNAGYNSLNKDWFPQVPLEIHTQTTVKRFSVGFDGKVPGIGWTWDAYVEYGHTQREQLEPNEIRAASFQMALDSVLVNGQPQCRVTAAGGLAGVQDPTNPYFNPNASYAFLNFAPITATSNPALYATNSALSQGCVPINPFGTGAIPSNSFAYSFGNLDERLGYSQTVGSVNASGELFKGIGAGPFSAAVGFEWRREQGNNSEVPSCLPGDSAASCAYRSQDFELQFGTPFSGLLTAEEVYGELNIPLAKDLPFAHLALIDVAARESRYDNTLRQALNEAAGQESTHDMLTWKISGFYEPIEGIRLRGSESRDERAADFRELYYGQVLQSGATGGFGYCSHLTSPNAFDDACVENLLGNVNLRPETSNTTTVGLVLTPVQAPGLQLSADWFHIRITNAIEQANALEVEQACASGQAAACSQIVFNTNAYTATGAVVPGFSTATAPCPAGDYCGAAAWQRGIDNAAVLNATSFNGAFYDQRGVDLSLSYVMTLPDNSTLFLRSLATFTDEQVYQNYPGGPITSLAGQASGNALLADFISAPRWRGNMSITWTKGVLSLTPSMNWVGKGTIDNTAVTRGPADANFVGGSTPCASPQDLYQEVACNSPAIRGAGYLILPFNSVPSYFVFNLNATISLEDKFGLKGLQIYGQVNNVFNRAPPFASAPGFFGNSGTAGTNPILYDTLGRDLRVGLRMTF
jgi:outer membrane receptor protein involved in Fe transport